MFSGLQDWESSTSAWRITATEFSVFLQSRSPSMPGMTDSFRQQIQRWLGDGYVNFFNSLVSELVLIGTWAELDNKQSLQMIREAAIHFPSRPSFSSEMLTGMLQRDLGL